MRAWRKRARFDNPDGRSMVRRLPASVVLAPRSFTGSSAVDDLFLKSLTLTQRTSSAHALTVTAGGSGYSGSLARFENSAGTAKTAITNAGGIATESPILITEDSVPSTPAANHTWDYTADKSGVSTRYWMDDAGNIYDLSKVGTGTTVTALSALAVMKWGNQ